MYGSDILAGCFLNADVDKMERDVEEEFLSKEGVVVEGVVVEGLAVNE